MSKVQVKTGVTENESDNGKRPKKLQQSEIRFRLCCWKRGNSSMLAVISVSEHRPFTINVVSGELYSHSENCLSPYMTLATGTNMI